MNILEVDTNTSKETEKVGERIGNNIKKGDIIVLFGELGSGKTTFVKGLAKKLGVSDVILSPTFTIISFYKGRYNFYHIDLFRIKDENELFTTGIEDCFMRDSVVAIEWAEKLGEFMPKQRISVNIKMIDNNRRRIIIKRVK